MPRGGPGPLNNFSSLSVASTFIKSPLSESIVLLAIHPFDAQADGELNLSIDDYVVVREMGPNGWSGGECKGMAGWFPSAYIERQEKHQ
ncbi:putative SH3 domain-containing protein [Rosa chinensis]|uniref:Putative SH3 domain-containing protein n=1 Tax=Rosa chinensis TaxID=74649 RepID=A0A2P6PB95_ROSCH|nr:putative SH3 domain-containing protein [Rosa chinensis]